MARLLITGGAGFIGVNFVYYWLDKYPEDRVVVLDALTYAGNLLSLDRAFGHRAFQFIHGDIVDQRLVEEVMIREGIDTIVHFAAETHVDRSITGPDPFVQTNIIGTHSLLKAARSVWLDGSNRPQCHRFHHISTDEVYGSLALEEPPFTESHPYAPNSPYAASKACSDHLVRAYHRTHGLSVTTTNCSNNFGAYQFPEKLIPLCLTNILLGSPLPIYGDGRNIRDWLFVDDHCRGIDMVLRDGTVGECYNIGGQNARENIVVVKALCQLVDERFGNQSELAARFPASPAIRAGSADLIHYVGDRPGHDRRYAVDTRKIVNELGFEPRETFESGLRRTVDWYLDNEKWWRSIMDGSYRAWMRDRYQARK